MRIYLDSNVLIAYCKLDFGKITDFMEEAFKNFLAICAEDKHELVLSNVFFEEVEKIAFSKKEESLEIIKRLADVSIKEIISSKEDTAKAQNIQKETGLHFSDSLHVQLALTSECDILLTWDKDFQRAKQKIKCLTPKEFT